MKFQPKIRRVRFSVSPFPADKMLEIGDALASSVKQRIQAGLDVYDQPAKPLKQKYARYKTQRGGSNLRDWTYTGRTLRALRTLSASDNKVRVGFSDPVAMQRAAFNNQRSRQFGMSPADLARVLRVINSVKFVSVKVA